jgi:malate dehydrogenase (oxaloacetate-decarboxylating)(NADP+)
MKSIRACADPMQKNLFLQSLQNRNEVLFYRTLIDNIQELAPIVYTPVIGLVCQKFGGTFRQPRGMYFSGRDRGFMSSMVYNWPEDNVDVIVVTDGSRILGLGDLGANGMGIPIGKLALYVAAGGIHPAKVLPVMLDTGTNNEELLEDPFYLGMQHPRLQGQDFFSLVDEFMQAVKHRWPNCLVQFEVTRALIPVEPCTFSLSIPPPFASSPRLLQDFSSDHAAEVLEKYRDTHLCFNDDIQGTGATALAGILSAVAASGSSLEDQRIVIVGAGSAGLGVGVNVLQVTTLHTVLLIIVVLIATPYSRDCCTLCFASTGPEAGRIVHGGGC